jgi:hypothetical protein
MMARVKLRDSLISASEGCRHHDTASAGIMVSKIESYLQGSNSGSWRNILCLVADDEDANLHMFDAEGLAEAASAAAPPLTVEKSILTLTGR